jgi:hypothetical protein
MRTKWAIDNVRRVNKADEVQQQPTHLGCDGEPATHRTTAPCTSRRPRKIARPPQKAGRPHQRLAKEAKRNPQNYSRRSDHCCGHQPINAAQVFRT